MASDIGRTMVVPQSYHVRMNLVLTFNFFSKWEQLKKEFLGGFSGKVGTVIGGSWKGIAYMRSIPQSVKDPRTLPQLTQRRKFALVQSLLQPVNELLRAGWKLYAHGKSPINAATAFTLANAISGEYPSLKIEPARVLVSRGSLIPATGTFVSFADGKVEFQWEDNSGNGSAKETDKAMVAIVNLEKDKQFQLPPEPRAPIVYKRLQSLPNGQAMKSTPTSVISEDGKEISNSVYVGPVAIN